MMTLADTTSVRFGQGQIGIYYLADTDQPAPFAMLLHGIPGSEKNHDLAYHLRVKGWHVLVLHFMGAWGSGGSYNPLNHPDEVRAALDFVLSSQSPRPIDPSKVALVGYSVGSRAALMVSAEDTRVRAVVSIAGICDFSDVMLSDDFFAAVAQFLNVPDWAALKTLFFGMGKGLQPYEVLEKIAPRPVLLLHGTEDEIVPAIHLDGFASAAHVQKVLLPDAGHLFALHRAELVQTVSDFLEKHV